MPIRPRGQVLEYELLSSGELRKRANRQGAVALKSVPRQPTLDTLVRAGERFSSALGLRTNAIGQLIGAALANGAIGASQNMVGHAVHAIVEDEMSEPLVKAFSSHPLRPQVDVFRIGTRLTSEVESETVDYQ